MNNVTSPLKPQMKGPSVADLQAGRQRCHPLLSWHVTKLGPTSCGDG